MNCTLRKTLVVLLAGSASSLTVTTARAISVTDLEILPSNGLSTSAAAPQYAWDGWNGITPNLGWAHNSQWYMFRITQRATVQITMSATDADMHPAFSVWQTNGTFVGTNHNSHAYNQVGLNGHSAFLKPAAPTWDGATAFIGYANAGKQFTNGDDKTVRGGSAGIFNRTSSASTIAVTLKAGLYLIAAGGSCNDQSCGKPSPKNFTLTIARLPAKP